MTPTARTPATCPHRRARPGEVRPSCGLVGAILGLDPPTVSEGACLACSGSAEPLARRPNPVVASLVAREAEAVGRLGGVPGLDAERADALRRWAHRYIPLAGPEASRAYRPPRADRPCHHLGASIGDGPALACSHPAHRATTLDGCFTCRDWSDRPRPDPRPLAEALPPPARSGPAVRSWAVGVTTAPRAVPTLDWTLDSLARAGWDEPRVFEDLPTPRADRHRRLATTTRDPEAGAWPNYHLGLMELLLRRPDADAYLMVQDDVIFPDRRDLRSDLEAILWPDDPPGLVSLYGSAAYTRPDDGWHRLDKPWVWGALAMIFPPGLARRFVADPLVVGHRASHPIRGLIGIDILIGTWADRASIPVHYPCPSLAQHIGDVSALWSSTRAFGYRQADRYLGDLDDPEDAPRDLAAAPGAER